MSELQTKDLTGEDLLTISANNPDTRYELIEGELIEMPPTGLEHGKFEFRIAKLIDRFVEEHRLGTVMTGEVGYHTRSDDKTVRAADVAFASYERMPQDETPSNYGNIAPELIVEIVSPNDSATKIEEKVNEWLDFGVSLVWIVYPKTKHIHVFTHDRSGTILRSDDTLTGADVLQGFKVAVSDLFDV